MIRNNMNYLAILIGAVAAWVFGAVYFSILGSAWTAGLGKPPGETFSYMPYVVSFIAELVMAWVLAGMVGRLGGAQVTPKNAIIYAVSGWLGFSAATLVTHHVYLGRSLIFTVIDIGHWLGVALIIGAVIGAMGVRKR